jgi:uncharacterized protein (UPF0305 family)
MGLISNIESFLSRLFSHDPEVARRRAELKKLHALLADYRPPYYRPKQNLVLPGFANAVYIFAAQLRPLAELARATVASADVRASQRFFDYLIDTRLTQAARERKEALSYDGMADRVGSSLDPERDIDSFSQEFQTLLREIEAASPRELNFELSEVERFIELCRHDYERILGLFDPGISLDAPDRRPEFSAIAGDQVLPELIDLHYVTEGFMFSDQLKQNLFRLLERRNPGGVDEARRRKLDKICAQLDRMLSDRLHKDLILSLIRAIKGDPHYTPATPRERRDFVDSYRRRLAQQFEHDRERIQRERHESAITSDIRSLFGEVDILEVDGYDDDADSFLRRESPMSFQWIKPIRILKTFVALVFEPSLKEAIKRVLVEGYFDNKNFQNNLANILYQCERSGGRITDFEDQMTGSGRISIVAMRRYIEEMRRGKDIEPFLKRLVEAINGRAKEIVEDESGLFAMLGDALADLLADYRKASPDLVTNIRTLAGGRNREIMAQLLAGRDRILLLVKVMRNFTFVKTPAPGAAAGRPAEGEAVGPAPMEPASAEPEVLDEEGLESLDDV